jgi:hypothetical protein
MRVLAWRHARATPRGCDASGDVMPGCACVRRGGCESACACVTKRDMYVRVHVCVTHCEMQSRWQEYEKSLQQIKARCVHEYVHVCVCANVLPHPLPSPALPPFSSLPLSAPNLLQPPSLPALSLLPLSPYRRLVRFLKIVSARWSSLLFFR